MRRPTNPLEALGRVLAPMLTLILGTSAPALAVQPPDTTGASLVLSWNAPPGQPRATRSLVRVSADTSASDTLYVCFIPGIDIPTLVGFTAEMRFRPVPPDTLAPHWRLMSPTRRLLKFDFQFAPDSMEGAASPFPVAGFGLQRAELLPDGAQLRLVFAVPIDKAGPVRAGQTYVLARLLVRHPALPRGVRPQPLCLEWVQGSISFGERNEPEVSRGERYVGLYAAEETVCAVWKSPNAKPYYIYEQPGRMR